MGSCFRRNDGKGALDDPNLVAPKKKKCSREQCDAICPDLVAKIF
jgi:hypothetical protein